MERRLLLLIDSVKTSDSGYITCLCRFVKTLDILDYTNMNNFTTLRRFGQLFVGDRRPWKVQGVLGY